MEEAVGLDSDHSWKLGGNFRWQNVTGVLKSQGEKDLVEGLLKGRVRWSGDIRKDYTVYLKNHHIIISLFTVHPLDPFTRLDRLIVYFAGLMWSVFSAGVALFQAQVHENDKEAQFRAELIWALTFGFWITVFTTIMKKFARCGAGRPYLQCCGKCFGGCGLVLGLQFSSILMIVGIILAYLTDDFSDSEFWLTFLQSQLYSYFYGLFTGFILFYYSFKKESGTERQKLLANQRDASGFSEVASPDMQDP